LAEPILILGDRMTRTRNIEESLEQAERMLQAFESVEVERLALTLTTEDRQKIDFRPTLTMNGLRRYLPGLLDRSQLERLNIIIRPRVRIGTRLIQLDDLNVEKVRRVGEYGFLVLETSPGNYQVWLAVGASQSEFVRRLKRGVGADPGASGAVRLAGSMNFKRKYAPNYPRVRLVSADVEQPYANVEHLEQAGLLAAPFPPQREPGLGLSSVRGGRAPNAWPDYARCVAKAPVAEHGGPDISRADYVWAKIALQRFRWIQQPERVVEKLSALSPKAIGKPEGEGLSYCRLTVENALRACYRDRGAADGNS
jgi:hypothetical protein